MFDQSKGSSGKGASSFDWKAFSQKTWVIVLAGILLPLAGIVLAWIKPGWTKRTKWIATVLMGLVLVGRMRAREDVTGGDGSSAVVSGTTGSNRRETPYKEGYRDGKNSGDGHVQNLLDFQKRIKEEKPSEHERLAIVTAMEDVRNAMRRLANIMKEQRDVEKQAINTASPERRKAYVDSYEFSRGVYDGFMSVAGRYLR